MKIGIVTDVHEAVEPLSEALAEFRRQQVDCVVTIGDTCDLYTAKRSRADDVVALLRQAKAIGVWGNHDIGLCFDVPDLVRENATPTTLEFMATMKPQLVVGDCRFSHVEPWLDTNKVEDLWNFDGPPDTLAKAIRSFEAVPERILFVGHFHRWLVIADSGLIAFNGEAPLSLDRHSRHLIVVAPVMAGWCAIYDDAESVLIPIRLQSTAD